MKRVDLLIVESITCPGGLGMRMPEGGLFGHIRQALKDAGFAPGDRAMIVPVPEAATDEDECPGEGKCHGCLAWCSRCGDVGNVCDMAFCDAHPQEDR